MHCWYRVNKFSVSAFVLARAEALVGGGVFFVSLSFLLGSGVSPSVDVVNTSESEDENAGMSNCTPCAISLPPVRSPCCRVLLIDCLVLKCSCLCRASFVVFLLS